jgi:hypothetical protein
MGMDLSAANSPISTHWLMGALACQPRTSWTRRLWGMLRVPRTAWPGVRSPDCVERAGEFPDRPSRIPGGRHR